MKHMIEKNILQTHLNPKLIFTSCEFKDINLDNIENLMYSAQQYRSPNTESEDTDDSYELIFVDESVRTYDDLDDNQDDNDCVCFEYEGEENEETDNNMKNGRISQLESEEDEECSYENSSSYDSEDDLEYEVPACKEINKSANLLERAMQLEASKPAKPVLFPQEKMCFWFGNEDSEQIEEIFKTYTGFLHPERDLKNFKRGSKSYVASIKREPIVPVNKCNVFQTLDTILIFRKDLNIPNGVSFPITNILFSLTNWNTSEGLPTSIDIISCEQRLSDIKTLRVATNLKPSYLSSLPSTEDLQHEHHFIVTDYYVDIMRDSSLKAFKCSYPQDIFASFRSYDDGKGTFFDPKDPIDPNSNLMKGD